MRMPSHSTLCSFVFSLLLTSALIPSSGDVSLAAAGAPAAQLAAQTALNGLRAQGLAGGSELALPSPAATPAAASVAAASAPVPTLTPEIMAKLLKLVADKGVDRDLLPLVATHLGMTSPWASRSVIFKEDSGPVHGLYISRGADQDLVIALNLPGKTIYSYRARRDGTATAAFAYDQQTRQITMLTPADAQKSLDVQVAFWTSLVSNQTMASH